MIDKGLALRDTVGAGGGDIPPTATLTDWPAVPPAPLQTKVKVLVEVKAEVTSLPAVALVPDHAPDA
ncbi:MAG: hypothetical protein ACE5H7_11815 [Acidiferrobacterales bacterium]